MIRFENPSHSVSLENAVFESVDVGGYLLDVTNDFNQVLLKNWWEKKAKKKKKIIESTYI